MKVVPHLSPHSSQKLIQTPVSPQKSSPLQKSGQQATSSQNIQKSPPLQKLPQIPTSSQPQKVPYCLKILFQANMKDSGQGFAGKKKNKSTLK